MEVEGTICHNEGEEWVGESTIEGGGKYPINDRRNGFGE